MGAKCRCNSHVDIPRPHPGRKVLNLILRRSLLYEGHNRKLPGWIFVHNQGEPGRGRRTEEKGSVQGIKVYKLTSLNLVDEPAWYSRKSTWNERVIRSRLSGRMRCYLWHT